MSDHPYGILVGLGLTMATDETIEANSRVTITDKDAVRGSSTVPQPHGVCDPHLGTFDHTTKCATCKLTAPHCTGHAGMIVANYPVYSPLFLSTALLWLRVTCHDCGSPMIANVRSRVKKGGAAAKAAKSADSDDEITRPTVSRRSLNAWASELRTYANSHDDLLCQVCNWKYRNFDVRRTHPCVIAYVESTKRSVIKETHSADNWSSIIWPHMIREIFNKIDDSTVLAVGLPLSSHPRACVWTKIPVTPNNVRPELRNHNGEVTSRNDITTYLSSIVDTNNKISTGKNYGEMIADDPTRELILKLNELVYSMIITQINKNAKINGSDKPLISLMERQKGKRGRIRGNLLGRRTTNSARSFITCNTLLNVDEVGIPMAVATSQYQCEVVRSYNFERCSTYFYSSEYPRCRKIIRDGSTYNVNSKHRIILSLRIGDVIMRDIVDGDPVILNRQPSLEPSSLCCLKARIFPNINTFQLNVETCYFFNADFDGDAMNIYFPNNQRSANEILMLCSPANFFIAQKNGLNKLGEDQDALVGLAGLSAQRTVFDRRGAMQLFADLSFIPEFAGDRIPGRDIISAGLIANNFLINYKGVPNIYGDIYRANRKYDEADTKINIVNGKLLSGVIDKGSVGRDKGGGILHQIYDHSGPTAALRACEMLQRFALRYLYKNGLTISMSDMIVHPDMLVKIRSTEVGILENSRKITADLNAGKIIAPVGQTIGEYYESLQINALRHGSSMLNDTLAGINPEQNGLYTMISTGARGATSNFSAITCGVGPTDINGGRHPELLNGRCLPFFTRYTADPHGRGYISSSYVAGLRPSEWMAHSIEARLQLISKSLSTAVVGEMSRRSIKNLENTIVNNHRQMINNGKIIQMVYGGDGVDPKYLKHVAVPTADNELTAVAFAAKYNAAARAGTDATAALRAEFEQLCCDRNQYIELWCKLLAVNPQRSYSYKVFLPVDVNKIIHNVQAADQLAAADLLRTGGKPLPREKFDAVEAIAIVTKLCAELPYVLYNTAWRKALQPLATYHSETVTMFCIHARSYLCVAQCMDMNISLAQLRQISEIIYMRYSMALIDYGRAMGIVAAQSISEPMTQTVLDSAHRVGAQGGGGGGMKRIKEILEARETEKMNTQGKYINLPPMMMLHVLKKYQHDEIMVGEFAAQIEMLTLRRFAKTTMVIYEDYGKPMHPDLQGDHKMFVDFERLHTGAKMRPDLTKWCIRIELKKEEMFQKQLHSCGEIAAKLMSKHSGLWIVYTPNEAETAVLRIYLRPSALSTWNSGTVRELSRSIMDTTIRGVSGIFSAFVAKRVLNEVESVVVNNLDIKNVLGRNCYYIVTEGTNIAEVLKLPFIDPDMVISNALKEMEEMYGIAIARNRIIAELRRQLENISYRHYCVYADEITCTGVFTSMSRFGSVKRNKSYLLHISDARPKKIIADAALAGAYDTLDNVSPAIIMGRAPKLGNRYQSYIMDTDYIAEMAGDTEKMVNDLFA